MMNFRGTGRAEEGTTKSIFHKCAFPIWTGFPTNDTTGVKIQFSSQIMPAFAGWQVGNVGDPGLLGLALKWYRPAARGG